MSEMKTLNGYSFVDTTAREGVRQLSEEVEELKSKEDSTQVIGAVPVVGITTIKNGTFSFYTENNYSRAAINPIGFYVKKGYTVNVKLSNSDYWMLYRIGICSEPDLDFTMVPVKSQTMPGEYTAVVEGSDWLNVGYVSYTSNNDLTVFSINFRRNDQGAITADDLVAIQNALTITISNGADASSDENSIITRNKDMIPAVQAAARCGYSKVGQWYVDEQLAMAVTTDLHHDVDRFDSALEYMDKVSYIDMGVCLGDLQGSYFTDNDGKWFTDAVNGAQKIMYPVLGNHDAGNTNGTDKSATKQQQFDKYFAPVLTKIGKSDLATTYYSVNTDYGVTLIVLDCHDVPDTMTNDTTFAVSRGTLGYSQAQIDWLISTLAAVPSENHVIVAVHNTLDHATMVEGAWTHKVHMNGGLESQYDYPDMIPAIIDTWQKGSALNKTYAPAVNTAQPTINVSVDFSERGVGVFAGYIRGHSHRDYVAKMTNYPAQNIYCFSATACDAYQNANNDLPRIIGEKSEDCITVVAVDKTIRKVKLVRIGSNITFDMVRRDMIAVSY